MTDWEGKGDSNLLFVSGLSTLLQSLFETQLPSVVVGSYPYIIPTT